MIGWNIFDEDSDRHSRGIHENSVLISDYHSKPCQTLLFIQMIWVWYVLDVLEWFGTFWNVLVFFWVVSLFVETFFLTICILSFLEWFWFLLKKLGNRSFFLDDLFFLNDCFVLILFGMIWYFGLVFLWTFPWVFGSCWICWHVFRGFCECFGGFWMFWVCCGSFSNSQESQGNLIL